MLALLGFIGIGIYMYLSFSSPFQASEWVADSPQGATSRYSPQQYLGEFNDEMASGPGRAGIETRKEMVDRFCQSVTSIRAWDDLGFKQGDMYYRPDRSLWVYMFCGYLEVDELDDFDEMYEDFDNILNDQNEFELYHPIREWNNIENACDTSTDMNDCSFVADFPSLLRSQILRWEEGDRLMWVEVDSTKATSLQSILQDPLRWSINDLYNTILSELVDLKQMGLYGLGGGEEGIEGAIENFSNKYFGDVCGDQNIYLNDTSLEWEYNFCSHPETYDNLREYMESAQQIAKRLTIFDRDEEAGVSLYEKVETDHDGIISPDNMDVGQWFACGVSECKYEYEDDEVSVDSRKHFKRILLNELMWYNKFVTTYNTFLTNRTDLSPMGVGFGAREDIALQHAEEAQQAARSLAITQEATNAAYRQLTNFYMAFPIHIWNQAYMEDIDNLNQKYRHIYTPIHQLYYKLRNVQESS